MNATPIQLIQTANLIDDAILFAEWLAPHLKQTTVTTARIGWLLTKITFKAALLITLALGCLALVAGYEFRGWCDRLVENAIDPNSLEAFDRKLAEVAPVVEEVQLAQVEEVEREPKTVERFPGWTTEQLRREGLRRGIKNAGRMRKVELLAIL